jgi:ParB family chromosome partitioning protein
LRAVPATIDLAGAEIELVSVVARESRLQRAIRGSEAEYDYVFIDCPPSLGLLTVNALVAAEEVLIPIQCEYYALEGVRALTENIEMIRSHLNPVLEVSTVLLTMYDRPDPAGRSRRAGRAGPLRGEVPQRRHPAERPGVRGAELQPIGDDVRSRLAGCRELLRGGPGDRPAGCAARAARCSAHPVRRELMKSTRRGGLGRGLGALIPTGPAVPAPSGGSDGGSVATVEAPHPPMAPTVIGQPSPTRESVPSQPAAGCRRGPGGDGADPAGPVAQPEPEPDGLAPVPVRASPRSRSRRSRRTRSSPGRSSTRRPLDELKTSIEEVGFLQPIVVRELGRDRFELVMGERRLRAAQALGKESIPAIVRETARRRDAPGRAPGEHPPGEPEPARRGRRQYQQLLEEFGATHEELARRIGRSRPQISNTIRLLNLPPAVQRRVAAGVLMAGHARALLAIADSEEQESLARRIVAEGLSVRATEELVKLAQADAEEGRKSTPPQRRARAHAPALNDLADKLSDRFDTRVKVDIGRRKGKITIEFATVDDLERIVGIIGVQE